MLYTCKIFLSLFSQDADPRGFSSHWEARVLQGSIMTAMLAEPPLVRIDRITLSALQDTGWYSVNLSQAQNLLWGESKPGSISTMRIGMNPQEWLIQYVSNRNNYYRNYRRQPPLTEE